MKKGTITLLLLLFSVAFFGQEINVKGVVKDAATGETLPGVSVVVKGTSVGTETDFDGMYQLKNVKKGSTLIFSYLGMQTKEVVANKEVINVTLDESAQQLDEIVVVGYGTQRKKEVTGAVSLISSETGSPPVNFEVRVSCNSGGSERIASISSRRSEAMFRFMYGWST